MPAQNYVSLTAEEQHQLEKNIKSRKTALRLVERSKIILLAAQDIPNYKIAQQLNMDINKVCRWRNRFEQSGLPGIEKD